ncbi:glycine cleavage system protein R [Zooshikella harenae]|uniref:Glycine cleavage system transcriptional repressor n=1 Tax=Zooshikella harenae TaxID=2827238 RepID=A0ABS5ZGL8_9GAMM|nr:ACT domain-containing protein [Zooshikella harenae]MBU2713209.1 hypothetical protein [Zooshikella harenae]
MKKRFILTLMGPESPGLIRLLAEKTHARQGVWLKSKISHLEGQCAGIIKVEVDEGQAEPLQTELTNITDLYAVISEVQPPLPVDIKRLQLTVEADDRPGFINDISNILESCGASISNMECHRFAVTELGRSVFKADFNLKVPTDIDQDSLVAELEALNVRVVANILAE